MDLHTTTSVSRTSFSSTSLCELPLGVECIITNGETLGDNYYYLGHYGGTVTFVETSTMGGTLVELLLGPYYYGRHSGTYFWGTITVGGTLALLLLGTILV